MYTGRLEGEPILMPWQSKPFNNDSFIANEFIKLRDQFNIDTVVEGGTCVGGSAKFLGENFPYVDTIEIVPEYQAIAKRRCEGILNIEFHLGSTVDILPKILSECTNATILWLDSHWNEHFPLLEELEIIRISGLKPVIIVHDCKVPGEPELGFDSYKGVDISFETMEASLDAIYGKGKYDYHYNTAAESGEVKRGVIFIYQKQ